MNAGAISLKFLAQEGLLKIPFFQRSYVWKEDNWRELLTDLLEALVMKESRFLGSIIIKQQPSQLGQPKEALVIDGQQRLTTLSILIRALYDSFDTTTKNACQQGFDSILFYKKNETDSILEVKIDHSKVDRENYIKVIRGTGGQVDESSRIVDCYKYFAEQLSKLPERKRKDLFNNLLDNENKMLVGITITDNDNEQAIFDAINSAGVRLSGADIVKNALFQRAFEVFVSNIEKVESLYSVFWEKIFAPDEESVAFWETKRVTGRLERDNIELLLHSIGVIEGFFDPVKDKLEDLSKRYKDHITGMDASRLQAFIESIAEYAKIYRDKIKVFDSKSLFTYSDSEDRLFHILAVLGVSTFHPYILHLYKKFGSDSNTLIAELHKIEQLVVGRTITGGETRNFNILCKDLIKDHAKIDSEIAKTSAADILDGLQNRPISNKNATLLLFWIELYRRNWDSKKNDITRLNYVYSLEHVMPQKWEEFWGSVPIVDEAGEVIANSEEAKAFRAKLIYTIGNMTLLKSSLNTSIRNYGFEKKVNGADGKKGISEYADLVITKTDIIKPFDAGDNVWNEQKILARTKALAADVLKIWYDGAMPPQVELIHTTSSADENGNTSDTCNTITSNPPEGGPDAPKQSLGLNTSYAGYSLAELESMARERDIPFKRYNSDKIHRMRLIMALKKG